MVFILFLYYVQLLQFCAPGPVMPHPILFILLIIHPFFIALVMSEINLAASLFYRGYCFYVFNTSANWLWWLLGRPFFAPSVYLWECSGSLLWCLRALLLVRVDRLGKTCISFFIHAAPSDHNKQSFCFKSPYDSISSSIVLVNLTVPRLYHMQELPSTFSWACVGRLLLKSSYFHTPSPTPPQVVSRYICLYIQEALRLAPLKGLRYIVITTSSTHFPYINRWCAIWGFPVLHLPFSWHFCIYHLFLQTGGTI